MYQPSDNRVKYSAFVGSLMVILCQSCNPSADRPCQTRLEELQNQHRQLQQDLERQEKLRQQLTDELENLRGMSAQRLEHLVRVAGITFGRFTKAIDTDNDGYDDGIKVYLQLRDHQGDTIKAAGTVDLELWDLDATANPRLYQHHFDLRETAGGWLGGFMADHFKWVISWPKEQPPTHGHLTLKLTFTEALTGQSWQIQQMVIAHLRP